MNIWKKRLIVAGCAVLALAISFACGFYFHKPDVRIEERIVEREVEKIVAVEKEVIKEVKVYVKSDNVVTHTETTTTTKPDGTTTTVERTDTETNTVETTHNDTDTVRTDSTTTDTTTDTGRDTTITQTYSKPDWRVGAKVGLDISSLSIEKILTTGSLTYGASVERRIVGPIWVGAWGLTSGQVGINLSMEF